MTTAEPEAPTRESARHKLTKIYAALSREASTEEARATAINHLLLLFDTKDLGAAASAKSAFRNCSPATSRAELKALAIRARKLSTAVSEPRRSTKKSRELLADRIERLHFPTITALADSPLREFERLLWDSVRLRLPGFLRDSDATCADLAKPLLMLAIAAETANPTEGREEGAPTDRLAHIIADFVARHYSRLVGECPTIIVDPADGKLKAGKPRGLFLETLTGVFDALGVRAKPLSVARSALRRLEQNRFFDPLAS